MDEQSEASEAPHPVATVSKVVLSAFLEDLAKIEGFKDIAANLEKVVINDGVFAEPAIRAAIFPDAT
jgi:hypothetical protein